MSEDLKINNQFLQKPIKLSFPKDNSIAQNIDELIFNEDFSTSETIEANSLTTSDYPACFTSEQQLDEISTEYLYEIVGNYTDRNDLSQEEYGQILAINQLSSSFSSIYEQYGSQLTKEGFIDNIYNSIKDVTGLGITREMLEEEFESQNNSIKILTSFINKDYSTSEAILKEEFIRKINKESGGNIVDQFYKFLEYYQDENEAIEKFNEFTNKNKDFNNPDIIISKDENNDFTIKIGENESIKLSELGDYKNNQFLNFYYQIDTNNFDENFLDTKISSDFNSLYKFLTGVEYDIDNIQDYTIKNYIYSGLNTGYYTAYQLQQNLSGKSVDEVFSEFLKSSNNDKTKAIEAFNNYYSSILKENAVSKDIYSEGELQSIEAVENEYGEIEYIYTIKPYDDNFYMLNSIGKYDSLTGTIKATYNPAELIELYKNEEYEKYQKLSQNTPFFENLMWQINEDVKNNNILTQRFEEEFEKQNGLTPEEAYRQYQESYSKALGSNNLQTALDNYISDMDSYADKLSNLISLGSIGLSFIFPPFGYVALGAAAIDNTIDAVNMLTNTTNEDDWNSLIEETFKEAALIAIGFRIGYSANNIGNSVKQGILSSGKNIKLASIAGTAVETATDVGLGMGVDYLTTGELNYSGNGLSGIIDIITGIRGYKAISALGKNADINISTPKEYDVTVPKISEETIDIAKVTEFETPDISPIKTNDTTLDIPKTTGETPKNPDTQLLEKNISSEEIIPEGDIKNNKELRIYYGQKTLNEAIEKIIENGGTIDEKRLATAQDIIQEGVSDQKIRSYAQELSNLYSSETYTRDTMESIGEILGFRVEKNVLPDEHGIYTSDNETGKVSARAKGEDSTYSKIRNKILELKCDLPESIEEAKGLIGDSQGVRIVINTDTLTSDTIKNLKISSEMFESSKDIDLFVSYLNGNKTGIPEAKLEHFANIESNILNKVSEAQSATFVQNLTQSIENGDIVINEINNYAGQNGIPYLSKSQVTQIQQAYANWYQKTLKETTIGNTQYEIRYDKHGTAYLFDTNAQAKFYSTLPTKSASIDSSGVKNSGYTALQINLVNQYGQNTELQFRGRAIDEIAELEHVIYDSKKNKETASKPIYHDIKATLAKIKTSPNEKNLTNELNKYYTDVFTTARKQELGLSAEFPDIHDYPLLVELYSEDELYTLSLDGMKDLHDRIKQEESK